MSLSPEKTVQAIRLLHSGSVNTVAALKSLIEILDLQKEQIKALTNRVEALEVNRLG